MTTAVRVVVVAAAAVLGAFAAVGCLLAALFEAQGFGRPRDAEPRTWYLVAMGLGVAASVVVPVVLWRKLLPGSAPGWILAGALAVVGVLLVLGISLRG